MCNHCCNHNLASGASALYCIPRIR
uniref:Uncharacterized protein n=1 Tax=Anguilla anguilla TaxID=7936 RepID=A0A0E9TP91_ANGAN